MTPGPASGTASVSTMKIPVPIVAPTPNIVSWNSPIERLSSPPSASGLVSVTNASTGFLRNRLCRAADPLLMTATSPTGSTRPNRKVPIASVQSFSSRVAGGAGLPSTDEQPGLDDIAERGHDHAPRFQALLQKGPPRSRPAL